VTRRRGELRAENAALAARAKEIDALRAEGRPTVPTRIGMELKTNPFLRPDSAEIQANLGMEGAPLHEVFAELQRSRLAAVMQNNPYRFYAVSGSSAYRIHNDVDGDYLEDDGEVTSRYLDQTGLGVQLASSDVVTFLANGTALGSGSISITDGRGGVRHVEVSSGGSIRIR